MSEFKAWPKIKNLLNTRHNFVTYKEAVDAGFIEARKPGDYELPNVEYKAKVKLHGTNAAIRTDPDGTVTAQSRTRDITPDDDNHGFATWVADHWKSTHPVSTLIVYGEWCGPGINQGCSIHKIDHKVFAVFAIRLGDQMVTEPDKLKLMLPGAEGMYIIPWYEGDAAGTIDMADAEEVSIAAERLGPVVLEVEACDPWVKATFGIEGTGEGLVMYPVGVTDAEELASLMFKAKGEKHAVVKKRPKRVLDPDMQDRIDEFVTMFVTPNRCLQAAAEVCEGEVSKRYTGAYLKWVSRDILAESPAELAEAGLEWKEVARAVSVAARTWFFVNERLTV